MPLLIVAAGAFGAGYLASGSLSRNLLIAGAVGVAIYYGVKK